MHTFHALFQVFYAQPFPDSGYQFSKCAVKKLPKIDDPDSRRLFVLEGDMMKSFKTAYIVKLLGFSAMRGEPTLIVLEYMEKVSYFSFSSFSLPDDRIVVCFKVL